MPFTGAAGSGEPNLVQRRAGAVAAARAGGRRARGDVRVREERAGRARDPVGRRSKQVRLPLLEQAVRGARRAQVKRVQAQRKPVARARRARGRGALALVHSRLVEAGVVLRAAA